MICIQKKANAQLQKGGVHSQQPLKFSITSFALIFDKQNIKSFLSSLMKSYLKV